MNESFDLVLYNGIVVNSSTITQPPIYIGVKNEKIACISSEPLSGRKLIDCEGAFITPGGIDSHVHIEQPLNFPMDTFESATRSAICGGTTTVISFVSQDRDSESAISDLEKYKKRAEGNVYCDYGFHLIVSDPKPMLLEKELPIIVDKYGITSVKVYMTYDALKLSDAQLLQVLTTGRKLGITVMVHAENKEIIDFLIQKFKKAEMTEPVYHAKSRPYLAEDEASYRVITLSKLADHSVLIVHMSAKSALDHVKRAQTKNFPIYAETCPQYLFLTSKYLESHCSCACSKKLEFNNHNIEVDTSDSFQGAKYICSPPLRDTNEDLDGVWDALNNGTVTVYSSDHAPTKYNHPRGKKMGLIGEKMDFSKVPNGLPGVETRLPLLFCYGVETGRINPQKFVELSSTNPAKLYGMSHIKGSIDVGLDADFVVWYPKGKLEPFRLKNENLHHDMDYTPFEGMLFTNWPRYSILRGKVVWDRDSSCSQKFQQTGRYLRRMGSTMKSNRNSELPKYFY